MSEVREYVGYSVKGYSGKREREGERVHTYEYIQRILP